MQTMMEKMGKEHSMVKDQVTALETDVLADTPDSKQVAAHSNALLKTLRHDVEDAWWTQTR